ncbi:MAG TPA: hypothetical protein VGM68_05935 [Rhizomicrobium sp.]|jgi:hypothetical protein
MNNGISDQDFTDRAVRRLPPAATPPGFEAALLAAYDAWAEARPQGWRAAWRAGLRRFADLVWPGVPAWAPVAAFAAALLVGIGLGTALPFAMDEDDIAFSLEQPVAFNLVSSDQPQEDL